MAKHPLIPGIEQYPDLQRRMERELSNLRVSSGCQADCEQGKVLRRFADRVNKQVVADRRVRKP